MSKTLLRDTSLKLGGSPEGQVVQRAEAFLQTDGTHERSVGRRAHEGEAEKR